MLTNEENLILILPPFSHDWYFQSITFYKFKIKKKKLENRQNIKLRKEKKKYLWILKLIKMKKENKYLFECNKCGFEKNKNMNKQKHFFRCCPLLWMKFGFEDFSHLVAEYFSKK